MVQVGGKAARKARGGAGAGYCGSKQARRQLRYTHTSRLLNYRCGGRQGGMAWEVRVSRCKLVQRGWINNKVLL